MSKSNGCDYNGQNEMEGTGGQKGKVQARSKAGKIKKELSKSGFVCFSSQNSLDFEVSSEDVMIRIYLEVLTKCRSTFPVSPAVTLREAKIQEKESKQQGERSLG